MKDYIKYSFMLIAGIIFIGFIISAQVNTFFDGNTLVTLFEFVPTGFLLFMGIFLIIKRWHRKGKHFGQRFLKDKIIEHYLFIVLFILLAILLLLVWVTGPYFNNNQMSPLFLITIAIIVFSLLDVRKKLMAFIKEEDKINSNSLQKNEEILPSSFSNDEKSKS